MTQELNCLKFQTTDLEVETTCMLAQEGIPHVTVREGNMTARHADSQVGLAITRMAHVASNVFVTVLCSFKYENTKFRHWDHEKKNTGK